MTDLLSLKKDDRVLEIGTGSGYQAAVLSLLARDVYSVERIPELAMKARKLLKSKRYKNVFIKTGNGELGWKAKSPFDAILITAGMEKVPQGLFDQLKNGGVLVAPVGKGRDKEMVKYTKKGRRLKIEKHGVFNFVPFIESN
jgi:protein-L-isoaspartate(D-aspartate) O-methyltransferase